MTTASTFIVDCHRCKAKVAAREEGRAEKSLWIEEIGEPYGQRLFLGICPGCESFLVGESQQINFSGYDAQDDFWSDIVRVFPNPPKTFVSYRIPKVVKDSLLEADRSLQANANVAACVMLGRALEALCRDVLQSSRDYGDPYTTGPVKKEGKKGRLTLGAGIKKLRDQKIIDGRLFDWSQQLQAFRNLAAHPEDIEISRVDAQDLQTFVNAIVEYVYDLTDRYDEFKRRVELRHPIKKA